MQDDPDRSHDAKPRAAPPAGSRAEVRAARQKAALKANMARRKAQVRARAPQDNGAAGGPDRKDG